MNHEMHDTHPHLLVIANATCDGIELFDEIRRHARSPDTDVLVIAPALISRLHWWTSDGDAGSVAAQERVTISLAHLRAAGINAHGTFGDANPMQAMDDAVRVFHPDDVIVATHPRHEANWHERDFVAHARKRFSMPITEVEVDAAHHHAHIVPAPVAA